MSEQISERFSRQADIVPAEKLASLKVTIVGTGAIGRQVALQLAAMGVSDLTLVDFDIVEEGNLAVQGFLEKDLGEAKVNAVADLCEEINSNISLNVVEDKYTIAIEPGDVVFSCVDKMDVRSFLHETVMNKAKLFIDGRMAAELFRVLTAFDQETHDYYRQTLFTDIEASPIRCTAKTTIYGSNIIAGIMIGQFTKWLRGVDLYCDINMNLLTVQLTADTPATAVAQLPGGFEDE